MDQRTTKTTVVVDGIELLKSEYSFGNFEDTTKSYDREIGRITFTTPVSYTHLTLPTIYSV